MVGNRGRDTSPELAVRRLVHATGLRYRVNARPVPGLRRTADLVFRPTRVAVFIDGCFWHGCPKHGSVPKTNVEFWSAKINGNRRRDRETGRHLRREGWLVLRFWEHENPTVVATRVAAVVRDRRSSRPR
jgi:DNA mismatch endonuclease (patch repair protein)